MHRVPNPRPRRRRQSLARLRRGSDRDEKRLQLHQPFRAPPVHENGSGRHEPLHPLQNHHGRRDGHEHDLQGRREGATYHVHRGRVRRHGYHLRVRELLHGQKASCDQLDRRAWEGCCC
ncbi:hypothetical protein I7I53_04803 [Histoplasma capsulatum var. duboisii H88]|uniref:Uncharacterized protein n=1 Tax=Ajellomyces capsulatus (strain H88) TaxID=544711 RepID=A0A8A1LTR9_AJEC8|nr:hypothetical protein I7I53_04803 [Histoplasma capsulatum var. duboisii H88]